MRKSNSILASTARTFGNSAPFGIMPAFRKFLAWCQTLRSFARTNYLFTSLFPVFNFSILYQVRGTQRPTSLYAWQGKTLDDMPWIATQKREIQRTIIRWRSHPLATILELTLVRMAAFCPQHHELNTEHSKPEVDNENSLLRLDSTLVGTILMMS